MRIRRPGWAAILAVLLCAPVWAGPYGISSKRLANGLDVIAVQNSTVPLVTIEICVKNGAFTEPPDYDGLSHLYEHMFFKGNREIPSQEAYMARVRELGMDFNGTTSTERVNYFFTLHKDNLRAGLAFMKNAIRYPLFDRTELEKEREVVLSEYDRNESQPEFYLRKAVQKALWRDYYSRKNTIGDRDVIATTTPEKMRTIQERYYVPNNSALLVSGDIDPAEVFRLAEAMYGDWPASPDPFEQFPVPSPDPLPASSALIVNRPVRTVTVFIQMMGPSVTQDPAATFAADVFSFVLRQQNSRFQKKLVESGLATSADIGYYTQAHVGPVYVQMSTTPDRLKAALRALYAEMAAFREPDYFTDDQMETAKALLESGEIYASEKASAFVHTVSFWWAVAGLDYYTKYVENLRAVSRADIDGFLKTYVTDTPMVVGALLSEETQGQIALTEEDLLP